MLSNPPYGKSWKSDLERMGGKDSITDPRFIIQHAGEGEYSLLTRSSDGQLLFMANLLSKMKENTPLGSRIATVHNGSSLFTGDAGQGESNIRRWIIENDWLEAIVALPLNMFYNTGIATYVWVLTNRKPEHRRGQVQLIDATSWFRPLRKNLGKKNCEFGQDDIDRILAAFLSLEQSEQSKVFPNEAFGYWKVTVERPLRLTVDLGEERRRQFAAICTEAGEVSLIKLVNLAAERLGEGSHSNYNDFSQKLKLLAEQEDLKLTAKRLKLIRDELAERDEDADPVVKKIHKPGKMEEDALHGLYPSRHGVFEYEPDPELRDTEQIPLLEEGGIAAFIGREVWPHAVDAWVDPESVKVGYEVSFTRHFYKPQPLRTLAQITADIRALEEETDTLLADIIGAGR